MLWRRHYSQAKTPRKAKRGKGADEGCRQCGNSPRGLHGRVEPWRQGRGGQELASCRDALTSSASDRATPHSGQSPLNGSWTLRLRSSCGLRFILVLRTCSTIREFRPATTFTCPYQTLTR